MEREREGEVGSHSSMSQDRQPVVFNFNFHPLCLEFFSKKKQREKLALNLKTFALFNAETL